MTRARKILLPEIADPRGRLMFAEQDRHFPFPAKRMFAIYDVADGARRGAHAHRTQEQFIVMLAGGCQVAIDEGDDHFVEQLSSPTEGLYIPPLVWIELEKFTKGAVCLVLTSDFFDEADYIRDRDEFKRATRPR